MENNRNKIESIIQKNAFVRERFGEYEVSGIDDAAREICKEFESLTTEIAELRKQLTPILVKNQLPEDDQKILFQLNNKEIRYGVFIKKDQWGRENMFCDGAFHFSAHVICWLPIPQINNK